MCNYQRITGHSLRQIRTQRRLTLQQAASQFPVSVATLSRKERGFEHINRDDIRRAIQVYELSPQECYHLWCAAGFIPEPSQLLSHDKPVPKALQLLVHQVAVPAAIVDSLCFIRVWNQDFASVWPAPLDMEEHAPHIVGDLLRYEPGTAFSKLWRENIRHIVQLFYQKSISLFGRPDFQLFIQQLEADHGQKFADCWAHAQTSDTVNPSSNAAFLPCRLTLPHASTLQTTSFIVIGSTVPLTPDYELYTLLPCQLADEQHRNTNSSPVTKT